MKNKKQNYFIIIMVVLVFVAIAIWSSLIASAATVVDSSGISTGGLAVSGNLSVAGETTVNNLNVTGKIGTTQSTFNLLTTYATTVNFASAATNLNIGDSTGTTTINNDLQTSSNLVIGGTLFVTGTTTLQDDVIWNMTNPKIFINSGETFNIRDRTDNSLAWSLSESGTTWQGGASSIGGTLVVNSGNIQSAAATLDIATNPSEVTTLNLATYANAISIGSTTGTTTINNVLSVAGTTTLGTTTLRGNLSFDTTDIYPSITVNAGNYFYVKTTENANLMLLQDLGGVTGALYTGQLHITGYLDTATLDSSPVSTVNLFNTNPYSDVNFAEASIDISIGSSSGTTAINNNLTPSKFTVPNGTDLPATCGVGQLFQDTNDNACTDANDGDGALCICKTGDSWAVVSNF